MSLGEALGDVLSFLPDWMVVVLISFVPFVELRGALPVAVAVYDMPLLEAALLSVAGNMVPVPFILWAFPRIERWFRRWPWWDRALDRLFASTRRRAQASVSRYGPPFLLVFVAIPFPTTGAWTGALIAYLFDLDRPRSLAVIFVGVVIAGVVVAALVAGAASAAWAITLGLLAAIVVIFIAARRYSARAGPEQGR